MTILSNRNRKKWTGVAAVVALAAIAIVSVIVVNSAGAAAAGGGQQPVTGRASGVFTGPDSGVGTFKALNIGQGDVAFSNLVTDPAGAFPVGDFICLPVTGGNQTFTVANGDALDMVYVRGDICLDSAGAPVFGEFETHITGGTGRFDRASGVIFIDADSNVSSFPNWISKFERASWIKFNGKANKRDRD